MRHHVYSIGFRLWQYTLWYSSAASTGWPLWWRCWYSQRESLLVELSRGKSKHSCWAQIKAFLFSRPSKRGEPCYKQVCANLTGLYLYQPRHTQAECRKSKFYGPDAKAACETVNLCSFSMQHQTKHQCVQGQYDLHFMACCSKTLLSGASLD